MPVIGLTPDIRRRRREVRERAGEELIGLAEKRVGIGRELCKFLDQNSVLNRVQVNRSAAVRRDAGNLAFTHKPNEPLFSAFTAARAVHRQNNSIGRRKFSHECKIISVRPGRII